jgi:hypothetical protein
MKDREILILLYEKFLKRFYEDNQLHIKASRDNQNVLTTFLLQVHKELNLNSIGVAYWYQYLIYQYDYWSTKNVAFGERITLKRVFAIKSWERFQQISDEFSWYNAELTLSKYNINRSIILEMKVRDRKNHTKLNDYEEEEKSRFLNKPIGFVNCIETTTLFNHRSTSCALCKVNQTCKNLLRENYIGVYIDRGYVR